MINSLREDTWISGVIYTGSPGCSMINTNIAGAYRYLESEEGYIHTDIQE